ncbi:MAG: hypothetical protein VB018_15760 [Lachnospiraceae bacterium]|nr:hypothetical protein [Lachnospiraceae bacterium]
MNKKRRPWALPKPIRFLKKARPKLSLKPHIYAVFWVNDEASVGLKNFMIMWLFI